MHDIESAALIIGDGACGTNLQNMTIPDSAWKDREGCNELLNTSAPDIVQELHRSFVDAGAMLLETNTFGATRIVLAEYGLEDEVGPINHAAVENARRAAQGHDSIWVAGSLGPTTKLVSLGHIDRDTLAAAFREQATALLEAGADVLLIETCQDLLQVKTAVVTAFEAMEALNREVPVMVSVTIEQTGTMLVGSDIATVAATLAPFPLFSLGLNCATGPDDMRSHMRYLSHNWPGRISCIPNQGLPEVQDGKTVYKMDPETYAARMREFVTELGISIAGGCCGTTPDHTRALVQALAGVTPAKREITS